MVLLNLVHGLSGSGTSTPGLSADFLHLVILHLGSSEPVSFSSSPNFDSSIFTPHTQRERGKVIGLDVLIYIYIYIYTVKPPRRDRIGDGMFGPCREVGPISEVLFVWCFFR